MLRRGDWLVSVVDGDKNIRYSPGRRRLRGGARPEKLIVGVYVDDLAVVYTHTDSHSLYSQFVKDLRKSGARMCSA